MRAVFTVWNYLLKERKAKSTSREVRVLNKGVNGGGKGTYGTFSRLSKTCWALIFPVTLASSPLLTYWGRLILPQKNMLAWYLRENTWQWNC